MTQHEALNILQTGVNVFLTGEPGSGKTHTVRTFVDWLRIHDIEPAVTASTGIAATHLSGITIHAWSGIGIQRALSKADVDAIASREHVARRLGKATTLIIDEISMLSAETLEMVDRVCRAVRRMNEPFGGLQVVLVGDFYQLPPISRTDTASFCFSSPVWETLNPVVCYLTEQHRHDDPDFLEVLAAIRAGAIEQSMLDRILTRQTKADTPLETIPRLYTHNEDVDRLNEEKLAAVPSSTVGYGMTSSGRPTLVESLKRGCLSPEQLKLKEGAVVMGTKNVAAVGLANGTLGTVVGFERGTSHPRVETKDGRTITISPVDWSVEEGGRVRATITQIPLRLAWAITVHKSQGMSMDAAAMDLSRCFTYGQGYVALSRVRQLAGLYVLGWNDAALAVHPEVQAVDRDFRTRSREAETAFEELEESGERSDLEQNFIRASGGTLHPEKKSAGKKRGGKPDTYEQTRALLAEGRSLRDVALERELTYGTISTHVEKLAQRGRLSAATLKKGMSPELVRALPAARRAFKKHGIKRLTPIAGALGGAEDHDDLRIIRALYVLESEVEEGR